MEWTALVATLVGAVIGVGTTLTTDRVRWRRDTVERDRETLRTVSAAFLEALTAARDAISDASRREGLPADERAQLARASISAHAVHAKQYQLELLASPEIGRMAKDTTYHLLLYQDAVMAGHTRDDPACAQARRAFRERREGLMGGPAVLADAAVRVSGASPGERAVRRRRGPLDPPGPGAAESGCGAARATAPLLVGQARGRCPPGDAGGPVLREPPCRWSST